MVKFVTPFIVLALALTGCGDKDDTATDTAGAAGETDTAEAVDTAAETL